MAKKIETGLLIRAQFGFDRIRQRGVVDSVEIRDPLAQLRCLLVAETLQRAVAELRGVEHRDFLRRRAEAVETKVGHRFVRGLHGGGVQLKPAAVRQLHESSRGRLQTVQIR